MICPIRVTSLLPAGATCQHTHTLSSSVGTTSTHTHTPVSSASTKIARVPNKATQSVYHKLYEQRSAVLLISDAETPPDLQ